MNILVTGSRGLLGKYLIKELRAHTRWNVLAGVHGSSNLRTETEKEIVLDIMNKEDVERIVGRIHPDLIVHIAALTDVDRCERNPKEAFRVNVEGTRNIVDAAVQSQAFVVFLSTDYVFDGTKKTPYVESDPCRPISVYGESKLAGEQYVAEHCRRYLILRTAWLFGSYRDNFVNHIVRLAQNSSVIEAVDDKVGSPTYALDLARFITKLVEQIEQGEVRSGIFHATNRGETSWFDYAKEILRILGKEEAVRLQAIPFSTLNRPAKRPPYSPLSVTKLERQLGFPIRTWQKALKSYLKEECHYV